MPVPRGSFRVLLVGSVALVAVLLLALGGCSSFRGGGADAVEVADSIAAALARKQPPPSLSSEEWARVQHLYAVRENQPLWSTGDGRLGRNASELVEALRQVDRQGLRPSDYPIVALDSAVAEASKRSPGAIARVDVLLTSAYVDLATDLLTGRLDPKRVARSWYIDPKRFDVDSAITTSFGDGHDIAHALSTIHPADVGYDTLVSELARYRAIEAKGGWGALPKGAKLKGGVTHPSVVMLRQRLAAEGYALKEDVPRPQTFDASVAGAVAEFQLRHGIPVDSAVGPMTRAALDVSAGLRADQIAANLERMRWLPTRLPERRIVVNIPDYHLDAFEGGRPVLTMRVVVGDELDGKNTPIFADSMQFVEFGPYWNVPEKIAIDEILPKVAEDPRYLEANDYEVVPANAGDDDPAVHPSSLSPEDITGKRYRIRQRPGDKNALGHVKFLFPNDFAVYLHDTPARGLFNSHARAASHGCVRVEDPAVLARFALEGAPEWTGERIDEALGAQEHVRVTLKRAIPVYLVYLTAFARDGKVEFRDDIYHIDTPLVRAVDDEAPAVAARDSVARGALTRLAQRLAAS